MKLLYINRYRVLNNGLMIFSTEAVACCRIFIVWSLAIIRIIWDMELYGYNINACWGKRKKNICRNQRTSSIS